MPAERDLVFGSYRLDLANEWVWHGEHAIRLTNKAFAVLRYLVDHAGQLVSKDELFAAVWPDVVVSDAALAVCIREIRQALHDEAKTPQFIATVHRRGYRFLAPVLHTVSGVPRQSPSPPSSTPSPLHPLPHLVGRETELGQLYQGLERALNGQRQIVFVTGEAGIGKTTLVEAFLAHATSEYELWVGRGQCIEHFGPGEAYLPVLEALGQLGREPGRERFLELLSHHAPTWLVQMPALLSASDLDVIQRKMQGASRERMLREMAEALEALTAERPLVLVLEDLHWSDYATVDLLSSLARRRQPARLLVVGTYRPVDIIVNEHPLRAIKQELQLHGMCEDRPLSFLTEAAVEKYLAVRFPSHRFPRGLTQIIHQRTDGNPLFLVTIAEYFVAQGLITETAGQWHARMVMEDGEIGVPESLCQMVETQFDQLDPQDQRVLEAASVVGVDFSVAAVAAGIEEAEMVVEEWCEGLTRRGQFLRSRGTVEWPDGTVTGKYGFVHAVYQEVLYERIGAARRMRLHQQIGEREERAYGNQVGERATELAVHFERGRDYRRAIHYLHQAAENAVRRYAQQEALDLLRKGLVLLQTLPASPQRDEQELLLHTTLGPVLMNLKGTATREVEHTYTRARELCRLVGETPHLFPVLRGLFASSVMRGHLDMGSELAGQLMRLAQQTQEPAFLLQSYYALGMTCYRQGAFLSAREHLEQTIALYQPHAHFLQAFRYGGADPGVGARCFLAWALWPLGYPDQALQRIREAITLARELSHPFSVVWALNFAAWVHRLRRERRATQEQAEAAIALAMEHEFKQMMALGSILRGTALGEGGADDEDLVHIRQGLEAWRSVGAEDGRPHFLAMLAEACRRVGQEDEGLSLVTEALAIVRRTGEAHYEAELYRLKGELTLAQSSVKRPQSTIRNPQLEAEACFQAALAVARRQGAKSWELRATMSLGRLWHRQGKKKAARQMLTEIFAWFTEGFATGDLQEAALLLKEWS